MQHKGQIVEIPVDSPIYNRELPVFNSKKEELLWHTQAPQYSLYDGFIVGGHFGIENYKIGQRKGLNISGRPNPLYIIQIDSKNNRIFVGSGDTHPGLRSKVLFFPNDKIEWQHHIDYSADFSSIATEVVFPHGTEPIQAQTYIDKEGIFIDFSNPIKTPLENQTLDLFIHKDLLAHLYINNI